MLTLDNLTPALVRLFWTKVDWSKGPNACWLWTAGCSSAGYGAFHIGRVSHYAHRVTWLLEHGFFSTGKVICHSCDAHYPIGDSTYKKCCNPRHLWEGTQLENVLDYIEKGRSVNNKLTAPQVLDVRQRWQHKEATQKALAQELGVALSTIQAILRRKIWNHV